MGNVVPSLAEKPADVQAILGMEMTEFMHLQQLGRGKFMKSHLCRRAGGKGGGGASAAAAAAAAFSGGDEGGAASSEKVVIKVYQRRAAAAGASGFASAAAEQARRLLLVREQLLLLCHLFRLSTQPSLLPYQRFEDNARSEACFLTRQHVAYNLAERLNSRPFLAPVEKLWLIYQLLRAVEQAHAAGVRHGDIKAENVMVTSWLWLFLTDFATFKPTFLPEDHPADFYYFFEAGTRRRCYIAPERFVMERDLDRLAMAGQAYAGLPGTSLTPTPPGTTTPTLGSSGATAAGAQAPPPPPPPPPTAVAAIPSLAPGAPPQTVYLWPCDTALTPAMDVFATGCTIAEVLLDGEAPFDLSALLRYRAANASATSVGQGGFDPLRAEGIAEGLAAADASGALTALVSHMIARDPAMRGSARGYLDANTAQPPPPPPAPGAPQPAAMPMRFVAPAAAGAAATEPAAAEANDDVVGGSRIFPAFFPFLFTLGAGLLQPDVQSADVRVLALASHYSAIVCTVTGGAIDPLGERLLAHRLALEPRHLVEMAAYTVRGARPDPRCTCSSSPSALHCAFCTSHVAARALGAASARAGASGGARAAPPVARALAVTVAEPERVTLPLPLPPFAAFVAPPAPPPAPPTPVLVAVNVPPVLVAVRLDWPLPAVPAVPPLL